MSKYDFLKQYVDFGKYSDIRPCNWFSRIDEKTIFLSEKKIGYKFPKSLREFWLEIGCGMLRISSTGVVANSYSNAVLSPSEIASIILGEEDAPMLPDYRDDFVHEGDIPFFEVADSSDYLFMKRDSEAPDMIYGASGYILEEHFEDFIRKLYYESPTYYEKIAREKLGISE